MYGSNQAASIEALALSNITETVRAIPEILGTGEKILNEAEMTTKGKLGISRKF